MATTLQHLEVETEKCGRLSVFVQGSLEERQGKTFFLTLHDMGCNHASMVAFVNTPSMAEVAANSVFLHVCAPGQEDFAMDLRPDFPTLDDLASDLSKVLDRVGVSSAIGLGEGAGANVLARWAGLDPNKVLGLALTHCTSTTAGVLENLKDQVLEWKMNTGQLPTAAEEYLVFQKFGPQADKSSPDVASFVGDLRKRLNPRNVAKFLHAFQHRTDLSSSLVQLLSATEVLLVVGGQASHVHTVHTMHAALPKGKSTLLVVEGVGDVMVQAPEKLSRALILFGKGCGALSRVAIPGMTQQKSLSSSMEAADK